MGTGSRSAGARTGHGLDEEVEVPLLAARALPLVAACSLHADPSIIEVLLCSCMKYSSRCQGSWLCARRGCRGEEQRRAKQRRQRPGNWGLEARGHWGGTGTSRVRALDGGSSKFPPQAPASLEGRRWRHWLQVPVAMPCAGAASPGRWCWTGFCVPGSFN